MVLYTSADALLWMQPPACSMVAAMPPSLRRPQRRAGWLQGRRPEAAGRRASQLPGAGEPWGAGCPGPARSSPGDGRRARGQGGCGGCSGLVPAPDWTGLVGCLWGAGRRVQGAGCIVQGAARRAPDGLGHDALGVGGAGEVQLLGHLGQADAAVRQVDAAQACGTGKGAGGAGVGGQEACGAPESRSRGGRACRRLQGRRRGSRAWIGLRCAGAGPGAQRVARAGLAGWPASGRGRAAWPLAPAPWLRSLRRPPGPAGAWRWGS
jgi:hypothetical protein